MGSMDATTIHAEIVNWLDWLKTEEGTKWAVQRIALQMEFEKTIAERKKRVAEEQQ